METKSRYEVIAELETKKRELIKEKNGLNDELLDREKALKMKERQKSDTNIILDREIEDLKEGIENFKRTMEERKETLGELIKSVDDSLARFNDLNKK
jgi:seryl-tRNA synthetase